jgi:alpha-glucosidase
VQRGVPGSTLELYIAAIAVRRTHDLASGAIEWLPSEPDVLAFRNGDLTIVANTGTSPASLPAGEIVIASGPAGDGVLPGDTTVWMRS